MSKSREDQEIDGAFVVGAVIVVLTLAVLCWLVAAAATLVGSGRPPGLSLVEAIAATARLAADGLWDAPRDAYPQTTADRMPGVAVWWSSASVVIATTATIVGWSFRRFEPQIARTRLARRPGDLRGARPRPWARPRDIPEPEPGGFSVGRLDRRTIRTAEESHVALIAPTRAGKTTRYVIPWLLEHEGPAIVTSTKTDILDATREARTAGEVWVFDPFGTESCSWDALEGCADWSSALRQAHWLAEATQQGDSELSSYWRGEAAKLLAPLLHAAALAEADIGTVLHWLDHQDPTETARRLLAEKAVAAERQLQAIRSLDDRNRGTTFMAAGSVLAAYRYPEVLALARTADLNVHGFFDGRPNTIYVVASERHQRLLEPILVALLSLLFHAAMERDADAPRLRVLLDEAANIAPLRDLPRIMSQAAGHGIRIATVWQSLAQMQERYRLGMHTILANTSAKIVMGSTSDEITRRYVEGLVTQDDETVASGLQHLDLGRALYLGSAGLPAVVTVAPFWARDARRIRARRSLAPVPLSAESRSDP